MGTTVKARALFCSKCSYVPTTVPILVDHLVATHDMTDEEAASRAVEIVGDVDPVVPSGRAQPRLSGDALIPGAMDMRPKTCHYCHRANGTHTPMCRVGGSGRRPICGRCKRILPAHSPRCPKAQPCFYCQKVAPKKCAHHGGTKKTSTEYKREKREQLATPAAAFVATLASLTARIVETREQLAKLETAHAALSALRE